MWALSQLEVTLDNRVEYIYMTRPRKVRVQEIIGTTVLNIQPPHPAGF